MTSHNPYHKPLTAKVSVVMPIYNVEAFVKDAINSVLAQEFTHFELILVNDCSPDNSLALCQSFSDPRIRIISHDVNQGLAAARNTGIRHAIGRYVAFIDSDDMWHPEKLAQHVEHLDNAPEVGISFSRSLFIDYQGNAINVFQMPQLTDISASDLLCRNPVGNGSAPVLRRETLADIRYQALNKSHPHSCYFDENFRQSEDIECWLRILATTHWKMEGLPAPLTYYRLNNQGLSADSNKQYASWENMINKASRYAPELLAQHENRARAYQLRYLARQAIRNNDGKEAVVRINQALKTSPSILKHETGRTLATLAAAYLLKILPRSAYKGIELAAQAVLGRMQRARISKDGVTAELMNSL
ncbi:glycosyltransferase [Shewanella sp. GutDb-MelDb]|uniref:glycosyltransferase family 2 protein n=1 Tax=Shewanella sp. GutDb-MelDb TaxID=2058316 RepID=UPI0015E0FD7D|nr:glycosyltransferase [Shewanella sp. GutDb-MelDb]